LRHLSAGQNIPGDFWEASAERILARQFPRSPTQAMSLPHRGHLSE
jgi:hypothetical protein